VDGDLKECGRPWSQTVLLMTGNKAGDGTRFERAADGQLIAPGRADSAAGLAAIGM
jgi:hypothetical protein